MIDYNKRKIKAHRIQEMLVKNPTPSELKFKDILDEIGINYGFQKKIFVKENFYIVDFYFPKYKIIFEIDGGIHNDNFEYDSNREIDIFQNSSQKINLIVRFPNEFVKNNREDTKKEIIDILNKRGNFYQGLINRKSKLLNEIGKEKDKERRKRKFLRNQLKQRPYLKSRLTNQEYEVISMAIGLDNNIFHPLEEINEKIGLTKDKITRIIGKLYWLIKTD